ELAGETEDYASQPSHAKLAATLRGRRVDSLDPASGFRQQPRHVLTREPAQVSCIAMAPLRVTERAAKGQIGNHRDVPRVWHRDMQYTAVRGHAPELPQESGWVDEVLKNVVAEDRVE